MLNSSKKFGAYVGRFNPVHIGHTRVIGKMLEEYGAENSIVVIGSSNTPISLRHFFSYGERKEFISKLFPSARLVGLPDYHDDSLWLVALDDLLRLAGMEPEEVVFFGGCKEDLYIYEKAGRECVVLNRFDGTTTNLSATEVRDALIHGRPLEEMLPSTILPDVETLFGKKWQEFKLL